LQLRVSQNSFGRKRAEQWWPAGGWGIGTFAEAKGRSGHSRAKDSSPWFCPVCRAKANVRQRSLFADLIFGYFVSRQSNSPPAAIERANVYSGLLTMRNAELN